MIPLHKAKSKPPRPPPPKPPTNYTGELVVQLELQVGVGGYPHTFELQPNSGKPHPLCAQTNVGL